MRPIRILVLAVAFAAMIVAQATVVSADPGPTTARPGLSASIDVDPGGGP